MRRTTLTTVAMTLAAGLACGGMGGGGGGGGTATLTSQQIREVQSQYDSMFEVIQNLRPMWLQTRGNVSFRDPEAQNPAVFVDGVEQGRVEALRRIDPADVEQAEFLSASDATTRYGTGYPGGIIRISTRSGG
ncbi:MAG: TonB-dependent receptor plug domain-containing protein [Gemmatimonadota bacterium]